MTAPISMAEYFATEAGEYLDRLRGLAERPNPAPEELVRYSRALRGAALMANQQLVARAAAGLEALAKGVREGRRPWDPGMANRFGGAVTELRELVRTAATWEDEQLRQAERLAQELEAHAGIASGGGPGATSRRRAPRPAAKPVSAHSSRGRAPWRPARWTGRPAPCARRRIPTNRSMPCCDGCSPFAGSRRSPTWPPCRKCSTRSNARWAN